MLSEIGLFPLNLVLVPGEQVPLHIFEPRYRELIGECLEEGTPFGLVLADDSGLREIGTEARVVEVLDQFDDGRMNIVVEGGERFKIVEMTEGRSFATAQIVPLSDEDDDPTAADVERCLAAFQRLAKAARTEIEEIDTERGSLAYQIAGRVEFDLEVKQSLLELSSERQRVAKLVPLLDQATEAVERQHLIQARASTNGRVEPP